jgi:NTP pyrophosphatase (non-canonical NTP hydrolase)
MFEDFKSDISMEKFMVSALESLQRQCHADSKDWFSEFRHTLQHHTLGLAGEMGEVAEHVKKIDRGSYTLEEAMDKVYMATKGKETIGAECADLFIYLLNIAHLAGFNLYEEYTKKRAINKGRWSK